jgi:hypothetical protein
MKEAHFLTLYTQLVKTSSRPVLLAYLIAKEGIACN